MIKRMGVVLLLALGACAAPQGDAGYGSSTLLIDEPSGPFPYNSRFCP